MAALKDEVDSRLFNFLFSKLPLEYDAQQETIDDQHQPIDGNDSHFKTILSIQPIIDRDQGQGKDSQEKADDKCPADSSFQAVLFNKYRRHE